MRPPVANISMGSDDPFRLLVESIQDYAIFLLDPSGCIRSWNAGARRIKGYTAEEIIGQHFGIFYPEDEVRSGKCELELSMAAREGRFEEEGWRLRKDGTRFWAWVVVTALRNEAGELVGFAKVTRDLSDKRRAEEHLRLSEERLRLLVESVKDYAMFMLTTEGEVATWNPGAERIKGYRADEIIGQHVSRFYSEEDIRQGRCERALEVALESGRFEDEVWLVRKDGRRFWANVVVTALWDAQGRHLGFTKVTRDLSERRRGEEQRTMLAQAQESVRLRDEFLAIAAHELRTPLTALKLELQSTRQGVGAADPATGRKLERASRSVKRLEDLVEALLDVSRLTTGRMVMQPQRFNLGDAVRDIVEGYREQAAKAGSVLSLELTEGVEGTWDRLRIEQVLTNLLANALKYGMGSPVHVTVGVDGPDAVLTVSDHGPGIADGDADRIFRRFERAAPFRHFGGLGLGLYLARKIVQAHGGSIQLARTTEKGGASFSVRLPRTSAESSSPRSEVGAAPSLDAAQK